MIKVQCKEDCCGCHACATVCAKHCITMKTDDEGFLYPVVDKDACIDCGLCEKVCPVINQSEPRKPLMVYAAKNKNEEIRHLSSSGGIFTLLAEKVASEGGIVFGARFNENWDVVHSWTDSIEGIADFRGSKYVQSTIGDTYREVKDFLKQDRKVLFSGTPCQIAGLRKFLRKEYDNLLTVDLICHGVPSPLAFKSYLLEELSLHNKLQTDIKDICFRRKYTKGGSGFQIDFKNNEKLDVMRLQHAYSIGFSSNLFLRPSCYHCAEKSLKSGSDITLGDYWGGEKVHGDYCDSKGISVVLVNTKKGTDWIEQFRKDWMISDYKFVVKYNSSVSESVKSHKRRAEFFENMEKEPFSILTNRLLRKTLFQRVVDIATRIFKKFK